MAGWGQKGSKGVKRGQKGGAAGGRGGLYGADGVLVRIVVRIVVPLLMLISTVFLCVPKILYQVVFP
jgi:hypothetical protein